MCIPSGSLLLKNKKGGRTHQTIQKSKKKTIEYLTLVSMTSEVEEYSYFALYFR